MGSLCEEHADFQRCFHLQSPFPRLRTEGWASLQHSSGADLTEAGVHAVDCGGRASGHPDPWKPCVEFGVGGQAVCRPRARVRRVGQEDGVRERPWAVPCRAEGISGPALPES